MNNLLHISQFVHSSTWAILPAAHASIRSLLASKMAGTLADTNAEDFKPSDNKVQFVGNVAFVAVSGVIIPAHASLLEKTCGAIGCNDIGDMISEAEARAGIDTIAFDFNTPGGSVQGVPELAARIATTKLRTVGFAGVKCTSAGQWLAASCQKFYCAPSAIVGSVGVFNAAIDSSAGHAAAGLKVEMFKSGDLKAAGFDGTPITAEHRAQFQSQVDTFFAMFRSHIQARHPGVSADVFRGQIFIGEQGRTVGLVDGICNSIEDAIALFRGTSRNVSSSMKSQNTTSTSTHAADWQSAGFTSPESFAAYQQAAGAGRVAPLSGNAIEFTSPRAKELYEAAATSGRIHAKPVSESALTAATVIGDDYESEWSASAELQDQFPGGAKGYALFKRAEAQGKSQSVNPHNTHDLHKPLQKEAIQGDGKPPRGTGLERRRRSMARQLRADGEGSRRQLPGRGVPVRTRPVRRAF